LIRLICNEQNQGVMRNFFGAVAKSNGKYLAFCDSDDLWSDPDKLTKQLKYLENNQDCMMVYHGYINKISDNLPSSQLSQFEKPINQILYTPQTSTMMVRGVLRDLINVNVVNESNILNDQYLRFLLKDKGYFECLHDIKPNIRIVRENSIYSTVNKLSKKRNALHSWQTFYKYHGYGKNQRYLSQKVNGITSSVKWLEFKEDKNLKKLWIAVLFDLKSGMFLRKIWANIKRALLNPLVYLKRRFVDNRSDYH